MLLRSRVWLSVSPVPVTGIATDGNVLYALTSNGVLCGAPTPLTLCYPLNVGASGIVFSQALGVLVTNGSLLYTLNDTHPQAVSLGYPLASTMGGGVLLGVDRGLLRGAAWVSPYSAYSAYSAHSGIISHPFFYSHYLGLYAIHFNFGVIC